MSKIRSEEDPGESPTLTPATGESKGTPASNKQRVEPQADAIEDEPLLLVTSLVRRMVYGKSCTCGKAGKIAFSARLPCPIATWCTKYFIRVEIKINNENKEFKEECYLPRRLAEDPPLDLITPVEKLGKS